MKTLSQKFQSLVQGSQFVVGTQQVERELIMSEIINNNKESLSISIEGVVIKLNANWSISRKSVNYYSDLTKKEYIAITGSELGLKKNKTPYISIQMDGRVEIFGGGNHRQSISNSSIIIL
ncbi:hypothetical protein [Tenacibaculum singaporense]|uniref:hypothetical protein n=1 Tax=Tenacibaculum singaporense TaxID=2358479 RepID=UPI000F6872F1|nr:hypothetical protein [Tenacibaculum singaporense]RSC96037.1 hypothetical protein EI424_02650 [Tenacibaculum singaporense]